MGISLSQSLSFFSIIYQVVTLFYTAFLTIYTFICSQLSPRDIVLSHTPVSVLLAGKIYSGLATDSTRVAVLLHLHQFSKWQGDAAFSWFSHRGRRETRHCKKREKAGSSKVGTRHTRCKLWSVSAGQGHRESKRTQERKGDARAG